MLRLHGKRNDPSAPSNYGRLCFGGPLCEATGAIWLINRQVIARQPT
jgi:hypothetical protein